jgi:hypothetical protein
MVLEATARCASAQRVRLFGVCLTSLMPLFASMAVDVPLRHD